MSDVSILSQSTIPLFPLSTHTVIVASALFAFILTAMFLIRHLLFSGITDEELGTFGISVNAVVPTVKIKPNSIKKIMSQILTLQSPKDICACEVCAPR